MRVGPYKVIDLCCGMGGFSYAAASLGLSVLAGVDTCEVYTRSFLENVTDAEVFVGDVLSESILHHLREVINKRKCRAQELIIVSGPPCQGFSCAGPRCDDDPRNNVIIAVAKLISQLKPIGGVIENVSALKSDNHKNTLNYTRRILTTYGYNTCCLELDSIDYGVPQRRKRVFVFFSQTKLSRIQLIEKLASREMAALSISDTIGDLPVPRPRPDNYNDDEPNSSIKNHFAMKHSESVVSKISNIGPGKGPLSYRRLVSGVQAPTLVSGHRAPPVHYEQNRSITVREALRLQGFPDVFRIRGPFSRQMEQVTNSVPLPLGRAVISTLVELLGGRNDI